MCWSELDIRLFDERRKNMKKFLLTFISAALLIALISCGNGADSKDSEVTETKNDNLYNGLETETNENGGITYTAPDPQIFEIDIPAEGERIDFDSELTIYEHYDGKKLAIYAIERQDDVISFYTHETEYFFEMMMSFITADNELFISPNATKLEDGSYRYDTLPMWPCEDDTYRSNIGELEYYLEGNRKEGISYCMSILGFLNEENDEK